MEELSANQQPVSAVYDTLKQQRNDDEHRPVRDSVNEKSEAVIELTEADGDIVRSEAQDAVNGMNKLDTALAASREGTTRRSAIVRSV
ncbi:hypothetical protein OS493_001083 [Desmophyllum pertusum]|uniref:Uncharacterized protein n=1 Tax=Desmophyllum pertusum TaxID=174260 RepID=A0A9W9ZUJ9_9CNID|nr:hypothetical protein OS493_001083 [Desmophyllum pertusum]